jgi:hypothetical protein
VNDVIGGVSEQRTGIIFSANKEEVTGKLNKIT